MAKRKNQKRRSAPSAAAAAAAPGTESNDDDAPAGAGGSLLLWASLVLLLAVPAALLIKTQFDAMSYEEALATVTLEEVAKTFAAPNIGHASQQKMTSAAEAPRDGDQRSLSELETAWDVNMHYTKDYDSKGLNALLRQLFDYNERAFDPSERRRALSPDYKARGSGFDRTTRHKLEHDLEQFDYFLRSGLVPSDSMELFQSTIPDLYKATLDRLDRASKRGEFDEDTEFYMFRREDQGILPYYNRMILAPSIQRTPGSLLTERDWGKVERQWLGEDVSFPHPGIVVIDNILSPKTLESVRTYLLLSSFWFESKTPKFGTYVGAYLNDGMHDEMMMEIAFDLHKSMPRVMKGHHLKEMWSYKYESSSNEKKGTGIHIHADDAMVNVNLWITPDDANLDPNSGGLVVYTVKPPRDWAFEQYNNNWEYVEENLLRPAGYANVTIPYKQNRAVIFDSFLFHKTDSHRFKRGYENRRINLTFLYGGSHASKFAKDGAGEL